MGECVANFRPRLVQKLFYDVNFLKNKRDEILSNYRQGVTYDIMAQLQKLKNQVDMVFKRAISPTDFNNLNLRNNRDLQAILLLIELGDIDEENPLDRFGHLGVGLRKDINVWWPFDKPNENADNVKEFLINGEWQLVRFDRQNRSYYYGTLINGGIEVKVRGQTKVREVTQEQVLRTFEQNANEKRILKRSLTAAKREYYRYPVGEQYWNYVITEDEALGARKRGDKISFKDVEDKKVQIDNVAILSVVLKNFKTDIYNEDRKDDDGKCLKLNEKQEIKMGDLVYRILGFIEEIDQEGNKKSFYKVFILPKNKKNMREYTTRRFFFLNTTDIDKLNAIPQENKKFYQCKNYKDGKLVGLAQYGVVDYWQYRIASITLFLGVFNPLKNWVPWVIPDFEVALSQYLQLSSYYGMIFSGSSIMATVSLFYFELIQPIFDMEKYYKSWLSGVQIFKIVIAKLMVAPLEKLILVIKTLYSSIASRVPMNSYFKSIYSQVFGMIKYIAKRCIDGIPTTVGFTLASLALRALSWVALPLGLDVDIETYTNQLRMIATLGWFICTAVCYDPCEVLLRNSGQLDKVPYNPNPKKRTRKEMELLAEQTLRLKF